jgi:hypothetical protein
MALEDWGVIPPLEEAGEGGIDEILPPRPGFDIVACLDRIEPVVGAPALWVPSTWAYADDSGVWALWARMYWLPVQVASLHAKHASVWTRLGGRMVQRTVQRGRLFGIPVGVTHG